MVGKYCISCLGGSLLGLGKGGIFFLLDLLIWRMKTVLGLVERVRVEQET